MQGTICRGVIAAVCAVVVGVTGCKSSDKPDPLTDPVKKPSEGDPRGPQVGGMARIPSNEPRFANPILEPRFSVANSLMFEGLVGLDGKLEPVPRLAESWEVAPDGKTITFKLQPKAKWHDGQPVTSADVAFTFEAIRNTTGATAWKAYMAPVQSVTTPDERTVVVTYAEPYAPALVTWTVGVLPRHRFLDKTTGKPVDIATSDSNLEPVGSGPFKLKRWEAGKRMFLEAHGDWWHAKPHLESVELVFGISDANALDELKQGQLDWARIGDVQAWVGVAHTAEFREQFEATEAVESRIRMIAWNTQRAPLDDVRVRRAMTLLLDRGRVIDDVLFGQAQPLSAPLFPTMFGYDSTIAPLPFDPDEARKLLDDAAPAKGGKRFAIEVLCVESLKGPQTDSMVAIFRRNASALGIDFKLTVLPSGEYYDRILKRDYDAVYFGWLPDIPDPDPSALLHSTQAQAGANYAAYANPKVDQLLEQARRTVDRDARKKAYQELQQILADEQPYTPLYAPYGHYAWTRRLHNVTARDAGPQAPLPGVAGWWLTKR
jgi:peptide/nickel transport system substrate-binding protein